MIKTSRKELTELFHYNYINIGPDTGDETYDVISITITSDYDSSNVYVTFNLSNGDYWTFIGKSIYFSIFNDIASVFDGYIPSICMDALIDYSSIVKVDQVDILSGGIALNFIGSNDDEYNEFNLNDIDFKKLLDSGKVDILIDIYKHIDSCKDEDAEIMAIKDEFLKKILDVCPDDVKVLILL